MFKKILVLLMMGTLPMMAIDLSITLEDIIILYITGVTVLTVGTYGLVRMILCKYKKFVSMYLLCMIGLYFVQGGVAFLMLPFFGFMDLLILGIKKMGLL
jgi:hypothetical protein